MYGDDRVRFCSSCNLNVYNLSGMSRQEVTELFRLVEGRLCVRFYRRKDGTVLTRDCPVGLKVAAPLARLAAFVIAASVPYWGTLIVVNWKDIQVSIASWLPARDRPTQGAIAPRPTPDVILGRPLIRSDTRPGWDRGGIEAAPGDRPPFRGRQRVR